MRHGTRRNAATGDALPDVARELARRLGAAAEDFRYVQIRYFDGQQWTVSAFWQQRIEGKWVDVDWTDFVL